MGSSRHPEEYQKLSRQIDAINKLPFSRELRNRMIERATAIWHRDDPDEFGGMDPHQLSAERFRTEPTEIRP